MKYNNDDILRLVMAVFFGGIILGMSIVWIIWYLVEKGIL